MTELRQQGEIAGQVLVFVQPDSPVLFHQASRVIPEPLMGTLGIALIISNDFKVGKE